MRSGRSLGALCAVFTAAAFVLAARAAGAIEPAEGERDLLGVGERCPDALRAAQAAGCRVVNLPEQRTFFVYWLPEGFEHLPARGVWVLLHGEGGNAYEMLLSLRQMAAEGGFGLASIQWARSDGASRTLLDPEAVCRVARAALSLLHERHGADPYRSAWFGFGRAAGYCAACALHDRLAGPHYFTLFVAASGALNGGDPVVTRMEAGKDGLLPLMGTNFYLWAGSGDSGGATEARMRRSAEVLRGLGATVRFRADRGASHDGFLQREEARQEALRLWRDSRPTVRTEDLLALYCAAAEDGPARFVLPVDVLGELGPAARPGDTVVALCLRKARSRGGPVWEELRAVRRLARLFQVQTPGLVKAVAFSSVADLRAQGGRVPPDTAWLIYVSAQDLTPEDELEHVETAVTEFARLAHEGGRRAAWAPGPWVIRKHGERIFTLADRLDRIDLVHTDLLRTDGLGACVSHTHRRAVLVWQANPDCEVGVQLAVNAKNRRQAARAFEAVHGTADLLWPCTEYDGPAVAHVLQALRPEPTAEKAAEGGGGLNFLPTAPR